MPLQFEAFSVMLLCFAALVAISVIRRRHLARSRATSVTPPGPPYRPRKINLTNVATNAVRHRYSTDSGDYTFPAVRARHSTTSGWSRPLSKRRARNNVQVQVQQTVRLDFTLEVGQVTESVEVSASAEMLQAENIVARHGDREQGRHRMPLNGRNYLGLVALAANVNTLSAIPVRPVAPGRRPRLPIDLRRRQPHHVRLLHARRRQQHRSGFLHLRGASLDRCDPGIQGADRHLSRRVRPSGDADQRGDQVRRQRLSRRAVRIRPQRQVRRRALRFTAATPSNRRSNGTITASKSTARCAFPKSSTAAIGCSSWPTTNGRRSARTRQTNYTVPTAAMFAGDFSAFGTTIYDPDTAAPPAQPRRRSPAT